MQRLSFVSQKVFISNFFRCRMRQECLERQNGFTQKCHFFSKKMPDSFGSFKKRTTFALAIGKMMNGCRNDAEIAQLVEHNLAKVRVASSSLVFRSAKKKRVALSKCPGGGMVDAHVSGACVERHAGSSPVLGTMKNNSFLFLFGGMAELVDAPL